MSFIHVALAAALTVVVWQSTPATQQPRTVGVSQRGSSAIEYIGMIEQVGPSFQATGYLTNVEGLQPSALFDGLPSESTARFTFSASAVIVNHTQVGATVQIGAPGQLSVYFNPTGGASFSDPASFAVGTEIAKLDVRFHNVLSVIAPNLGMSSGTAHGTQTAATAFSLHGTTLRLGHANLVHRFTLFGKGVRTDPATPASTTEFAASSITQ
jgi:hypothetical protein